MTFLQFAIKTAQKAGKILLKESTKNLQIREKAADDFVTNADLESEKLIIKAIKKTYPAHGIFAEESHTANMPNKEYIWLIDPLDGTTNYAHQLPLYCVSMGLLQIKKAEKSKNFNYLSGEIIAGVVFAPRLNELFYAEKGKGAYLNGKKIHVSNVRELSRAMTVTGFPPKNKEINMPYFTNMVRHSGVVRRFGAAALDLCYCARGAIDGFWELELKPWDIAAGSLIVIEAGGTVTDLNDQTLDLFGQEILATNTHIHREMMKKLASK
ncbi:inositol monophosphatase [Candidatus Peregrinibacteria bacterium]|nr:inositol monophosphatase [Candidatus Peregrinibacteria bacterium]